MIGGGDWGWRLGVVIGSGDREWCWGVGVEADVTQRLAPMEKQHRQLRAFAQQAPHVETECKENSARNVINKVISSLTNFLF